MHAKPLSEAADLTDLAFVPLEARHQEVLWDLLHMALWDPPPAPLRPRAVLQSPPVRIYAEDWGRPSDVGLLVKGSASDTCAGGCWMRILKAGAGLGYVDEATPQLGIALFPQYQRKGIGGRLLQAALKAAGGAGVTQVSLTVHPKNPAIRLYERSGFVDRGPRNTYRLMVASL